MSIKKMMNTVMIFAMVFGAVSPGFGGFVNVANAQEIKKQETTYATVLNKKTTVGIDKSNIRTLSIDKIKKENLSKSKKKLDTNLLKLVDNSFLLPNQNRTQIVSQMRGLKQFVSKADSVKIIDKRVINKTHNDLVYVYVNFQPSVKTSIIDSAAWKVTDRDEKNHLAVALVEVNKLEALASLGGVRSVSSVLPPVTNSGSVVTEGDIIHQTDKVRATHAQSGAGIKIGVISNGVDNIASAKSTGDLPVGVTVLSNSIGGDEGTAMLEIIYDMVPNASLYFHDAGSNVIAFNSAIDDLVAAGVNIIVDDVAQLAEPFFQDGTVASHVASVLDSKNIVYISSAGNSAKKHYQGSYYDDGYNFHDFSRNSTSNDYLYVNIPNNGEVTVILQWDDTFGSSGNDYDLVLFNANDYNSVLAASANLQNGVGDPIEGFSFTNTTGSSIDAEIDVNNYNGLAATKTLELFIYTSNGAHNYLNNITPTDSIFGHSAVPGVIAVGAIAANDPGNNTIESFSSQGPVTIIGQGQRAKPDVTGIDGVTVTGAGGFPTLFGGTSAAAPHIAAVVAQLWGQYPSATGNQIRDHLLNSAVDLGVAGTDTVFGHGRADSLLAFQAGPAITSFNFASPSAPGVINGSTKTIEVTVPYGTDVTTLIPTIAIIGASISPDTGVIRDFTSPTIYTVTAADGLTQDYVVTVTVAPATTHTISGTVKYYDGVKVVSNATVILEDLVGTQLATTTTDAGGDYQFAGVASGADYVVRVNKSDNALGLSSNDQIKIGRHIVGLELFSTIYKTIAGDVNNSGGLTSNDQIKIGRFIVGLDSNLPSGAWKFYSSNAILTTTNYLTHGLTRIFINLTVDTPNQDFVGVKMGDVNNSW